MAETDKLKKIAIETAKRNMKNIHGGKIDEKMFDDIWKQTGFNIYVFAFMLFNAGRRYERKKKEGEENGRV